mgnify:FL=1
MKSQSKKSICQRAYTLIEALVASSILLIGVGAAGSMSLSLVTQEEINERSVKAFNYLDNAARLYQMGVDPAGIAALLPSEPSVTGLTFSSRNLPVTGIGTIPAVTLNLTYKPTSSTVAATADTWTGGDKDVRRTESMEVIRTNSFLTDPLPRVQFFYP